jgi:ubiquinone/menaquinone biosynthesis C-methylase UbiE
MIEEKDSELLKAEVKDYWNENPCGTQFTGLQWGSREFFDEVERFRYDVQPFMADVMEFDKHKGERLLEIGCGLGTDLLQFARGGAIVTGVDLTEKSIDLVRKRFAVYNLAGEAMTADAEHLPFADNSFDIVYSFGVLHHTPNTPKAISETYRVLKPGGKIIMMLYHRQSLHVLLGSPAMRLMKRLRKKELSATDDWIRIYDGDRNPLGKAYTRSEVRAMMNRFSSLQFTTRDPIRRNWPAVANIVNQYLFASWMGFYLIIKGIK